MEVPLNQELENLIHLKVQSGPYRSAAEVVGTALHLLEERDRQERRQEELRREIQKGIDSGPSEPLDTESVKKRGREILARRTGGDHR